MSKTEPLESELERAHLLVVRGKLVEAQVLLVDLAGRNPCNVEAARLLDEVESRLRSDRKRTRRRKAGISGIRRGIMQFTGWASLALAYAVFRSSGGFRDDYTVATAGPVVWGLRAVYWRFLLAAGLALIGAIVLLISSFMDPDWSNFDSPTSRRPPLLFRWFWW